MQQWSVKQGRVSQVWEGSTAFVPLQSFSQLCLRFSSFWIRISCWFGVFGPELYDSWPVPWAFWRKIHSSRSPGKTSGFSDGWTLTLHLWDVAVLAQMAPSQWAVLCCTRRSESSSWSACWAQTLQKCAEKWERLRCQPAVGPKSRGGKHGGSPAPPPVLCTAIRSTRVLQPAGSNFSSYPYPRLCSAPFDATWFCAPTLRRRRNACGVSSWPPGQQPCPATHKTTPLYAHLAVSLSMSFLF